MKKILRVLLAFCFVFTILAVYSLLHIVLGIYLERSLGFNARWPLWILGVSSILCLIISRVKKNALTTAYYILGAAWMGVIFISSLVVLPVLVLHVLFKTQLYPWIVLPAIAALAIWAAYNSRATTTKTVVLSLDKLKKHLTIVQLTDLHIGEIYGTRFLERVVKTTNEQKPDIIVITGDLFDGGGKLYKGMIDSLARLKAKHKLFITGNHEVYEGVDVTTKLVKAQGITVLDDAAISVEGVQFAGLSYPKHFGDAKLDVLKRLGKKLKHNAPAILLRHEPRDLQAAAEAGFDIQLSGHTHNGQLWPLNHIVSKVYEFTTGLHQKDDLLLYIGPGIGTWGPPMRLGSRSEITVLKLVPLH